MYKFRAELQSNTMYVVKDIRLFHWDINLCIITNKTKEQKNEYSADLIDSIISIL